MSIVRVAPDPVLREGVTVRSPNLLMAGGPDAGELVGPDALGRLRRAGALRCACPPVVVVYRVATGEHQQTGVVAEVSVADYRSGRIRRHEATDPERERGLADYAETVGMEQTPVVLTHLPRSGLRETLAAVTAADSDVGFETDHGQIHSVWVVEDAELARIVQHELDSIATLYIADGHHRMAAAERYATRRDGIDVNHPARFTLGALFPSDEMRILGYPRSVPRPAGWSTADVIAALSAAHQSKGMEECATPEAARPGTVAVFLDGHWYRLRLRTPRDAGRASLDVVTLDETVIASVFDRVGSVSVPECSGAAAIADWCTEHNSIGFLPHPPSVAQVMAMSDAGQVMPAKSTWFHPKARTGLFVRELS